MIDLRGKIAIVTGASGGIGREIVKKLGEQNLKMVLAGRRIEALEEIKKEAGQNKEVFCLKCDVTKQADLEKLVNFTIEKFKKVNILINSAGVSSQYPFWEQPLEDIERVMWTNYYSYVMLSRLVVNQMKEAGGG
ncbi:MAG: SDR family oxidoreductase, partial [Candidatus Omnitrophica bacterium]|nr:SDR family oxidoreductase [Candidatus Omnitrophota bacterium]